MLGSIVDVTEALERFVDVQVSCEGRKKKERKRDPSGWGLANLLDSIPSLAPPPPTTLPHSPGMGSPTPEPTELPPGFHPDGLVTVSSLNLTAYLLFGFGPAGVPPGVLAGLTYSVHEGRLSVTFPPDILDNVHVKIGGGPYKEQPIVGWKAGIDTRPGDYISFCSSSHPFISGDHPLSEAATDVRLVRTNWQSDAEADPVVCVEAQPVPVGNWWPSNDSLPLDEGRRDPNKCGCPSCHPGGSEGEGTVPDREEV